MYTKIINNVSIKNVTWRLFAPVLYVLFAKLLFNHLLNLSV